jgi:hypothetical protein
MNCESALNIWESFQKAFRKIGIREITIKSAKIHTQYILLEDDIYALIFMLHWILRRMEFVWIQLCKSSQIPATAKVASVPLNFRPVQQTF